MSLEQIARDMKLGIFPKKSELTLLEEQRDRAINLGQELYEALLTADEALSMVQAGAVKGVPHGMDLNMVRAIIARAIGRKDAPLPNGDRGSAA